MAMIAFVGFCTTILTLSVIEEIDAIKRGRNDFRPKLRNAIMTEKMNKHTPGPWKVWSGHEVFVSAVFRDEENGAEIPDYENQICELYRSQQTQANARLIAAAPELLEMLQKVVHNIGDGDKRREALDLIKRINGDTDQ